MNVTTIGFPFASPAGAPALGGAEQGFALALGAASGFGVPALPGTAPAATGNAPNAPTLPADDAADATPFVRTQPAPAMTLAQLLATGSKLPIADGNTLPAKGPATGTEPGTGKVLPDQAPVDMAPELPAAPATTAKPATPAPVAGEPGTPVPAKPVPADGKTVAAPIPTPEAKPAPELAIADPATLPAPAAKPAETPIPAKPDANAPVADPTAATPDEPPLPSSAPVAPRPARAATPAATPVKPRKPLAAEEVPLPADPTTTQPAATPVAVAAPVQQPMAPTPVSTPDRKADTGRSTGKPVVGTVAQGDVPVFEGADPAAPALVKGPDDKSNNASLTDAGVPAEALKVEGKAGTPAAPQSFAAHVNQAAAPGATTAATPATPAAADPTIPGRAGQLGHALGVEIARKVDAGEDTLRVRLNPVELGRVEVTLAFDDRGNLRATMRAESQHALELLRQDAPDLGRALDSAGIRADSQSFRFESRSDGSGANGQSGQPGHQQSRGSNQHAFDEEPETTVPAYRAIRNDGQVDLLA